MRTCELLGLHLYDQTTDFFISKAASLNKPFVTFLLENKFFFKSYHDDYYLPKTPCLIAETINRDEHSVEKYLKENHPNCYLHGVFLKGSEIKLKYVSSFEIDFTLGDGKRININSLGFPAWHLGLKQIHIIDSLNKKDHKLYN